METSVILKHSASFHDIQNISIYFSVIPKTSFSFQVILSSEPFRSGRVSGFRASFHGSDSETLHFAALQLGSCAIFVPRLCVRVCVCVCVPFGVCLALPDLVMGRETYSREASTRAWTLSGSSGCVKRLQCLLCQMNKRRMRRTKRNGSIFFPAPDRWGKEGEEVRKSELRGVQRCMKRNVLA